MLMMLLFDVVFYMVSLLFIFVVVCFLFDFGFAIALVIISGAFHLLCFNLLIVVHIVVIVLLVAVDCLT